MAGETLYFCGKFDQDQVAAVGGDPAEGDLGLGVDHIVEVSLEVIDPDDFV